MTTHPFCCPPWCACWENHESEVGTVRSILQYKNDKTYLNTYIQMDLFIVYMSTQWHGIDGKYFKMWTGI